jgi:hypothetical protein
MRIGDNNFLVNDCISGCHGRLIGLALDLELPQFQIYDWWRLPNAGKE